MKNKLKHKNRLVQFPKNWKEFRYARSENMNTKIKTIIELYLDESVPTLDAIAKQTQLIDRRSVAAYLSKAKKKIA